MRNRKDIENRRNYFVIECFRNPYEVEYMRNRYYEFYLISIFANKEVRKSRGEFSELRDRRDQGDGIGLNMYKQNVSRCVYLSDIAINNEKSEDNYYRKLLKYYTLIRNTGCITPSTNETFMNQAYALSLRSRCLSRQVGAVIIGKNGYVVGAGWNDTGEGQIGCAYRQIIDIMNLDSDIIPTNTKLDRPFRDAILKKKKYNEHICYKDEFSDYVMIKKFRDLMKKGKKYFDRLNEIEKYDLEEIVSKEFKIKKFEYCRALHAEENALLQSSKIGGVGVSGGIIYTTSFPCELCAKMIYQSGIKEVVFTEPYPGSISEEVFMRDGIRNIKMTQFEGVKPHSYYRIYKSKMDKKDMLELKKEFGYFETT